VYVIAELLGIPSEQRDDLKRMSEVVSQFVDPLRGFDPAQMDATIDELRQLFEDLADQRRTDPGPDLFSGLVNVEENGDRLSHQELIAMAMLLLIGGHETTSGTIGNSIVALARNPEFRAGLSADPDDNLAAVDELLRYDTPVQATDRTVISEFTVGDKTLPAGAVVLVVVGAANRDPRRFDRPNELLLDRADGRAISFGRGPHHCIGASLARVETAAALTAFVNAFPQYELDEAGLVWRPSTTFRGPQSVPVRLGPQRAKTPAVSQPAAASTVSQSPSLGRHRRCPVGAGAGGA
jgi:cytochrome P450